MHARPALVLLFAGCDAVFGASPPPSVDAAPAVDGPPGDGILNPPAPTACGATPDLASWQFVETTFPSDLAVDGIAFYRRAGEVRAIATSATIDAFYDVGPDGIATPLPVMPNASSTVYAPSVDPAGDVVWFRQAGAATGVFYATRASGWMKKVADLGFIEAETVEPGAVGYVGGKARMVVTVREIGMDPTLHEIESADGLTWTPLSTVKLGPRTFHGHLSTDGCYLLFATSNTFTEIHVSTRDANGDFTTSTRVVPTMWTEATRPALTPDASALWFGCNGERCRGTP